MATTGTVQIDFGAFVAGVGGDVVATITGQAGILTSSLIEAWVMDGGSTADHSIDEHTVEALKCTAFNITAATGFQIRLECLNGPTYGKWNVAWVWN